MTESRTNRFLLLIMVLCLPIYAAHKRTSTALTKTAPAAKALKKIAEETPENSERSTITGTGAPRPGFEACRQSIVKFDTLVRENNITLTSPTICVRTDESNDLNFAPAFKGSSLYPLYVQNIKGTPFNSLSYCEMKRERMASDLAKETKVLESSCMRLAATNSQQTDLLYQPIVVIISNDKDQSFSIGKAAQKTVRNPSSPN